jgi:two-component system, NtrC family, sensor kinase
MNVATSEKNIINFVKYGAIISLAIFSFIITQIFIQQKNEYLENDIKILEKTYIDNNKINIKDLVGTFHSLIDLEKKTQEKDLKNQIVLYVKQAHSIASAIYERDILKADYSKEKTIETIKIALKEIRFNNHFGYMFMYERTGKNIFNAEFPQIEGKNLWNYKDGSGKLILQEMYNILNQKNETFYEWYWKKPKSGDKQFKKIGYFKKFEPFDMFIGTGDYVEDFENKIKNKILHKINNFGLKAPEHLFIYDLDGLCLANPKKELIGTNRYDSKNQNGEYTLRETLKYAKEKKEGFINYNSSIKLNENLISNEKISYLKLFEDWQWVIGSGFYLEELTNKIESRKHVLENSNKNAINKIVLISFIITVLLVFISFYLSNMLKNIFHDYKIKIKKELSDKLEKEKLLIQQSKMATMGEMIGNIAHQWKQPLNLISISNGMIKIEKEQNNIYDKEQISKAIVHIDNSVKYLSDTIDDFRDFFKPDKDKKYFDIKEAFDKTFGLIDSQFKHNNIEIFQEIQSINFYGYQNELLQVFINIIKNAKDELVKKEKAERKLLFINVKEDKNKIQIKIKDNAGGIADNIFDDIFKAYFSTKKEEGTGIGLYMSKQIIEAMNGKIEVSNCSFVYENETYTGAEFTITLIKS